MSELQTWTIGEAAFVAGEPLSAFKKVVERSPAQGRIITFGRTKVRTYTFRDLLFFRAARELDIHLTPKARETFYRTICRANSVPKLVVFGGITIDLSNYLEEVRGKVRELENAHAEIDVSPGREPLVKDTSIEVYRIAALVNGGMTIKEVLRDYPSLTEKQVQAAQAYADAHPKKGRPYPVSTAKAALRGAGLEALDEYL